MTPAKNQTSGLNQTLGVVIGGKMIANRQELRFGDTVYIFSYVPDRSEEG
jgi:hypothetical protein